MQMKLGTTNVGFYVILMLREERRLRVFENRVLRRIYGPNRDEVSGEWRKLPNEELHNLYPFSVTLHEIRFSYITCRKGKIANSLQNLCLLPTEL
jgi:hypothetical protein